MSYFADYVNKAGNFSDNESERKKLLREIARFRGGSDVLVYAATMQPKANWTNVRNSIEQSDLVPLIDQLRNMNGESLDLILETPGGIGEVAEEIVKICRGKYKNFSVIVPGWAKSAGTLIAMAGDEILMGQSSALGPIDAQMSWQGKVFSAGELLDGLAQIANDSNLSLNRAYIPILQNISPGEIQRAKNAQSFAMKLVAEWLEKYKFRAGKWDVHRTQGGPVTDGDRASRAMQIAKELADHNRWLTHSRSIRIDDLTALRLEVTDYDKNKELSEAINRYYALLHIAFESTQIYKVFETADSQVYRMVNQPAEQMSEMDTESLARKAKSCEITVQCKKCSAIFKLQANFVEGIATRDGLESFPKDNRARCPSCLHKNDMTEARQRIEMQTGKKVL